MRVRRALSGLLTDAVDGAVLVIDIWQGTAERTTEYERYLKRLPGNKHYRARPSDTSWYVSPIVQLRSNKALMYDMRGIVIFVYVMHDEKRRSRPIY